MKYVRSSAFTVIVCLSVRPSLIRFFLGIICYYVDVSLNIALVLLLAELPNLFAS